MLDICFGMTQLKNVFDPTGALCKLKCGESVEYFYPNLELIKPVDIMLQVHFHKWLWNRPHTFDLQLLCTSPS